MHLPAFIGNLKWASVSQSPLSTWKEKVLVVITCQNAGSTVALLLGTDVFGWLNAVWECFIRAMLQDSLNRSKETGPPRAAVSRVGVGHATKKESKELRHSLINSTKLWGIE